MAVLSGATASGRQFCASVLGTGSTTLYTAPALNANVTSPSATAYIKEIILANVAGSPVTVTMALNGGASLFGAITVNANDTKILSGLTTMLPAGGTITGYASAASSIECIISGVEIQ